MRRLLAVIRAPGSPGRRLQQFRQQGRQPRKVRQGGSDKADQGKSGQMPAVWPSRLPQAGFDIAGQHFDLTCQMGFCQIGVDGRQTGARFSTSTTGAAPREAASRPI